MKLKLFDYETYEDYGKEWFIQVLPFYPKFALLDISIQWDDYPSPEIFPMILFRIGSKSLCGFTFQWKKFYFSCDVLEFNRRNLEWYRTNR